MPVAVLLTTWSMGMSPPNLRVLFNVSFIVIGVIIASFGEIQFVMVGFLFQLGGILFEAIRLVMVQRLLSSSEYKMDPLVSLYYFAPVCAVMNGVVSLFLEIPYMTMENIYNAGIYTLLTNAMVAFMLNIAVVFLVSLVHKSRSSQLYIYIYRYICTNESTKDWQNVIPGPHPLRCPQGHHSRHHLRVLLQHPRHPAAAVRLHHRPGRHDVLQVGCRQAQGVRPGSQPHLGGVRRQKPRQAPHGRHRHGGRCPYSRGRLYDPLVQSQPGHEGSPASEHGRRRPHQGMNLVPRNNYLRSMVGRWKALNETITEQPSLSESPAEETKTKTFFLMDAKYSIGRTPR